MNTKTAEDILGASCYPHECGSMIEIVTKQDAIRAIDEYASPLKKRIEELETELAHQKFRTYMSDPEVSEWLKSVDDATYEKCKGIQHKLSALRALGTKGLMLIDEVLKLSTNGK